MIRLAVNAVADAHPGTHESSPDAPFTVAEVTGRAKRLLERKASNVWIAGEISRWVRSSGHLYLTLRDEAAQLHVVAFREVASRLPFDLPVGTEVLVRGTLTVFPGRGELQLRASALRSLDERGFWQQEVDRLREVLRAEGLLDPARKRALPRFPSTIGIATSAQGAALQDMLSVLERRYPAVQVVLAPTRVQGIDADVEIARAVRALSKEEVDVVIVGRGGGSAEDLWPFNSERVARALAACPFPTISAVGHETDFTVADLVADVRAPTPTAAAELAVPDVREIIPALDALARRHRKIVDDLLLAREADMEQAWEALHGSLTRSLHLDEMRLQAINPASLAAHVEGLILQREAQVSALGPAGLAAQLHGAFESFDTQLHAASPAVLGSTVARVLAHAAERLETSGPAVLRRVIEQQIDAVATQCVSARAELEALSPRAVLARGWALVRSGTDEVIRDPIQVSPGDAIHVLVAGGSLLARVEAITPTGEAA